MFSAGVGRRAAGVYRKRVTSADRAPSHSNRMSLAARTSTPGCSSASNWTPVGPWSALTSWPATNASSATPRPARRPLQVSKPYRDVEDSSLSAGSRSTTSPSTDGSSIHTAAGRGRPPLPARCRRSLVRGLLDQPERATQRLLERLIDAQLRPNGPSSRPRRPRLRLHQAGAVRGGAHLLAGKPRPLPGAWRPRWAGRSAPRPWRRPERGSPVSASPGDPAAPNGYPPCLGVGRTPSCCMSPSRSPSTHCSTILPSAIR